MIFSNYNSAIGCNCLENDWKTQISYSFFRTCCLTTPHHSYAHWSGLRSRANNVSHSGCLAAGFHASFFDDLPCKCRSNKTVSKKITTVFLSTHGRHDFTISCAWNPCETLTCAGLSVGLVNGGVSKIISLNRFLYSVLTRNGISTNPIPTRPLLQ